MSPSSRWPILNHSGPHDDEELFRREAIDANERAGWVRSRSQPFSFRLFTIAVAEHLCADSLPELREALHQTGHRAQAAVAESGWAKVIRNGAASSSRKHVKEGQAVRAGQLLYVLSLDRETADNSSIAGIGRLVEGGARASMAKSPTPRAVCPATRPAGEQAPGLPRGDRRHRTLHRGPEDPRKPRGECAGTIQRACSRMTTCRRAGTMRARRSDRPALAAPGSAARARRPQREIGALGDEPERLPISSKTDASCSMVSSADQEFTESELRRRIVVTAPRHATAANAKGQRAGRPSPAASCAARTRGASVPAPSHYGRFRACRRPRDGTLRRLPWVRHHEGRVSQGGAGCADQPGTLCPRPDAQEGRQRNRSSHHGACLPRRSGLRRSAAAAAERLGG